MSQQFQYLVLPKTTEKESSRQSIDTKVLSNIIHHCQNEEVTKSPPLVNGQKSGNGKLRRSGRCLLLLPQTDEPWKHCSKRERNQGCNGFIH